MILAPGAIGGFALGQRQPTELPRGTGIWGAAGRSIIVEDTRVAREEEDHGVLRASSDLSANLRERLGNVRGVYLIVPQQNTTAAFLTWSQTWAWSTSLSRSASRRGKQELFLVVIADAKRDDMQTTGLYGALAGDFHVRRTAVECTSRLAMA